MVTTRVSDHRMSDKMPITISLVIGPPAAAALTDSRSA
jgi:hypothetical protein